MRIPPGMPTKLLARLLVQPNQVVPAERIIDALWNDMPPASAANLVHGYVARLRRVLGADRIDTALGGYRLRADDLDERSFSALAGAGRPVEALALWRGNAFEGYAAEPWAQAVAAGLDDRRLVALEDAYELNLITGPSVVGDLESLVAEHPYRERLWASLVRALYAAGRQADALGAYRRARNALVDDLGIEPGLALRDAERSVLSQDESLVVRMPALPKARLPADTTGLIGREDDVGRVLRAMTSSRIVTVVGPGGSGKTRLVIEAARRQVEQRAGAIWFVDLVVIAALDDPTRALVDALRLRQAPGVAPLDAALAYLEERSALIVLDNCEHVLEAAADLALRITRGCPGVDVLATSREPLALPGESIIPIRGLPVDSAVALFTRRAAEVCAVVQNEEVAAEICAGLDGLPLALELAAAALVDQSAQEVATSVSSGRLEVTSRRGEPRHRSLDAVIAWGVDLLTSADADGLRSLSVFAGPFESAAADSVGAGASPGKATGLAQRLLLRSLLEREEDVAGHARFRMLDTVRAFARRSAAGNAWAAAERRHVEYHCEMLHAAAIGVQTEDSPLWMQRMQASQADLRASIAVAFDTDGDIATRMVAALCWPWFLNGNLAELAELSQRALAVPQSDPSVTAHLWWAVTAVQMAHGDLERADESATTQIDLARASGDTDIGAMGESVRGMVRWARSEHDAAARHHRAAIAMTEGQASWTSALVLALAARTAQAAGHDDSGELLAKAHAAAHSIGEPMVMASCDDYQGRAALDRGDLETAAALAAQSLRGYQAVGYQEGIASGLALAATVAVLRADWAAADAQFAASLDVCARLQHRGGTATAFDGLGIVAANRGREADAIDYFTRADAERNSTGTKIETTLRALRTEAMNRRT